MVKCIISVLVKNNNHWQWKDKHIKSDNPWAKVGLLTPDIAYYLVALAGQLSSNYVKPAGHKAPTMINM